MLCNGPCDSILDFQHLVINPINRFSFDVTSSLTRIDWTCIVWSVTNKFIFVESLQSSANPFLLEVTPFSINIKNWRLPRTHRFHAQLLFQLFVSHIKKNVTNKNTTSAAITQRPKEPLYALIVFLFLSKKYKSLVSNIRFFLNRIYW